MRAFIFTKYGDLDSMKVIQKEIPSPKPNQVIVKVKYSSLNAMEWHLTRGMALVKLKLGWSKPKPKHQTIGADVTGVITEVGANVKNYKVGDEIIGEIFTGGYAEYAACDVKMITPKPKEVSFEQAGVSPIAGLTALTALKKACDVQKGDAVLINGASGGVGSYSVLMAKYLGAEVTAVCSLKNFEFVKDLGADHCIDYNVTDFCAEGKKYKWVIDVTGNRKPKEIKGILETKGKAAIVGFTSAKLLLKLMFSFSKKIKMVNQIADPEIFQELTDILASRKVVMPITGRYKLNEIAQGIQQISSRKTRGKMIVEVEE